MARKNFLRFLELHEEINLLNSELSGVLRKTSGTDDYPDRYYELRLKMFPLEEEKDANYVSVVIFSAIFLEAFIYDYAAVNLGDKYARTHLEKLDLASKWSIIPQLVTHKAIDKGANAFNLLNILIKERNKLVHLKSKKITDFEALSNDLLMQDKYIFEITSSAFKAMHEFIDELKKIDPDEPLLYLDEDSIVKVE